MTDEPDKKEPREWDVTQGDYDWEKDPKTGEQVRVFLGYEKTWGE